VRHKKIGQHLSANSVRPIYINRVSLAQLQKMTGWHHPFVIHHCSLDGKGNASYNLYSETLVKQNITENMLITS